MEADHATIAEMLPALGLRADAVVEPASGGASGEAWRVRVDDAWYVIRAAASSTSTDARLAAMAAARGAGLPASTGTTRGVAIRCSISLARRAC